MFSKLVNRFSINRTALLVCYFFSPICSLDSLGQDNLSTITVPLAPNAAEFSKYGTFPVSLATGTPQISFPVYEINSGKLTVPISLSYHASGIKVNQEATWVGLGWSLNAGGIISRTVRGIPDEENLNGWIDSEMTVDEIVNLIGDPENYNEVGRFADDIQDSHPDFYTYNLPGKSGKFIFRKTKNAFESIPYEAIRIERPSGNPNNTFFITDDDGTKYYFEDTESYVDDNTTFTSYVQSWYLSKIISYDDTDTISFTYGLEHIGAPQPEKILRSSSRTFRREEGQAAYADEGAVESSSYFYVTPLVLREIKFKSGKVVFDANLARQDMKGGALQNIQVLSKGKNGYTVIRDFSFEYDYFSTPTPLTQYDYRLKLLSFSENDLNSDAAVTHKFHYNDVKLPSTNSYNQDYWGYYNGSNYGNFLPNVRITHPDLYWWHQTNIGGANRNASDDHILAGMLNEIIYPTGGYTKFSFKPNKYKSNNTITYQTPVVELRTEGLGRLNFSQKKETFEWPQNAVSGTGTVTVTLSPHTNPGAADVPQKVILRDVTSNTILDYWEHNMNDFTEEYKVVEDYYFDPSHTYEVECFVDDNPPTFVSIQITTNIQETREVFTSAAGVRIEEIKNYDHNDEILGREMYTYSSDGGTGVGILLREEKDFIANFYERTYQYIKPGCVGFPCDCTGTGTTITYVGSATYPTITFEGSSIYYGSVTKTSYDKANIPNGRTIYNFRQPSGSGYYTILNASLPGGKEFIGSSLNSNGQLTRQTIQRYDLAEQEFAPLQEIIYDYKILNLSEEKAISIWRTYFYPVGFTCITEHTNYDYQTYNIKLGVYKKEKITQNDYSASGEVLKSETTFFYDNPVHANVSRESRSTSDGGAYELRTTYPHDFTGTEFGSNLLRGKGIYNRVLEYAEYKGNNLVSKTSTSYKNSSKSVVPNFIQVALNDGPLETRQKFYEYDENGNVLHLSKFDGQQEYDNVVYIWGYYKDKIIAEIKNATKAEVDAVIQNQNISFEDESGNPLSNEELSSKLNLLRQYLPHAMIQSYIYHPLVGVKSITDINNITHHYEFDGLGRLKVIKDNKNNILKMYSYEYQK